MSMRLSSAIAMILLSARVGIAQNVKDDVAPLIQASCLGCHDSDTTTGLNLEVLSSDLDDPATFRKWVRVFDRVANGEMPPSTEPRPQAPLLDKAIESLKRDLRESNLELQRKRGRVPSRRLTPLEYGYTLRDLLLIDEDVSKSLPPESDGGGFDMVGASQRISPIHVRSYLEAAERAVAVALNLGIRPSNGPRAVDYANSPYLNRFHELPLDQGGSVTKRIGDAVVIFVDLDYLMRSDANGLAILHPGRYRINVEAAAHQAKKPVTLKLIRAGERSGGAELLGAFDLAPGEPRKVETIAFMRPGDYVYPSIAGLDSPFAVYPAGGAKLYKGPGIAIRSLVVEGPLFDAWPPPSTQRLLAGLNLKETDKPGDKVYEVALTKEPMLHIAEVVERFARGAFRRPLVEGEEESYTDSARPAIAAGRSFADAVRIPLRSILSSPQFLFFHGEPGKLDDFALASRLSYFLWRSLPDDELLRLAEAGKLSGPETLDRQVDRLLDDPKAERFVKDFVNQWLELRNLNATTPDKHLYPEYDDVLNRSLTYETELFFQELIREDLPVSNLIDADFTFLNRRLAEHYKIPGVQGQDFQKVKLPYDSLRGGLLTQSSILKTTANGTVTSPVRRGNFILTNLLGQPPDPPPLGVGAIEPDTRGKTTIRELLAAHRSEESCNRCHSKIDPPGFALEGFDPIGGFRTRYRAVGFKSANPFPGPSYKQGLAVDSSGTTSEGKAFSGFEEFRTLLMGRLDEVATHFIGRLIVFSTGGEIEFADRDRVSEIAERTRGRGYPVRTLIHEVVRSKLFRNL